MPPEKTVREELAELRRYVDWANYRLTELEKQEAGRTATTVAPPAPRPAPAVVSRPAAAAAAVRTPAAPQPGPATRKPARKPVTLEDLLSPTRLAWAGGVILFIGLCFLVSYGIKQGIITPEMRIGLAALVSAGVGAIGYRLRQKGDEGAVPLAMLAVSIAGGFATVSAGQNLYGIFGSVEFALALAAGVAALGAAVAVRWRSEPLGALALFGALLAPLITGANYGPDLFWFTFAAFAATMAICTITGWRLLTLPALLVAAGSAAACLNDASAATVIIGWSLIWIAAQVGATGPRLRGTHAAELPKDLVGLSTVLSAAIIVANGGYFQAFNANEQAAKVWVLTLGIVHLLIAAAAFTKRVGRLRFAEVDALIGATLLAIGTALVLDGPALVIAWSAQGAAAAWGLRLADDRPLARLLARTSAIAFIGLATLQALTHDAVPALLSESASSIGTSGVLNAVAALLSIAAAGAIFAWRDRSPARDAGTMVAFAATTYALAIVLDGTALVCALSAAAVLMLMLVPERLAQERTIAAVTLITLAAGHVLAIEAPLNDTLLDRLSSLGDTVIALVAVAVALGALAWRGLAELRVYALAATGVVLIYLATAVLDDVALVLTFCGAAAALAVVTRERFSTEGLIGAGVLIALAIGHVLAIEAPIDDTLRDELANLAAAGTSLAAIAAAFGVVAWSRSDLARTAGLAGAGITLTFLATASLNGYALVCTFCAGAILVTLLTREHLRNEGLIASAGLIALAMGHVVVYEAPFQQVFIDGLGNTGVAVISLLAIALALGVVAEFGPKAGVEWAVWGAAVSLVYLGSALIITTFPPSTDLAGESAGGSKGQALLSAFWALVALGAVVGGLRRDIVALRFGGLVLLMVALAKIFFIDLANLSAGSRTISFMAVGGVLLAVAFAFQRLRVVDDAESPHTPVGP